MVEVRKSKTQRTVPGMQAPEALPATSALADLVPRHRRSLKLNWSP